MQWISGTAVLLALVACQPVPGPATPPEAVCAAPGYGGFVGTNAAAVTFPTGINVRILGPNSAATTDYLPDRLNVRVNSVGTIVSLDCG